MKPRIKIIACRVLESELTRAAEKYKIVTIPVYLEAGLHDNPKRLSAELQAAVDRTDDEVRAGEPYAAILIGYGICGGGTLGLQAGLVPLIIPRVHDCISLFLGSVKTYRQEFAGNPGTLYMTRDWYEHKTQPISSKGKSREPNNRNDWNIIAGYDNIREKYGNENAEAIYAFINSWQKNYTRSVFIDNGEGDDSKYARYAKSLADGLGWEYKRIEGSPRFFDAMVSERSSGEDILIVPPSHIVAWDPVRKGLYSYHPDEGEADPWARPLPDSAGMSGDTGSLGENAAQPEREGVGLGIDAGGTYTDAVIYDFNQKKVLAKSKARTTKWDFTRGISEALEGLDPTLLEQVDITVVSTTLATNSIVEETGRKVGLLLMPLGKPDLSRVQAYPCTLVKGRVSIDGRLEEGVDPEEILNVCKEMIRREKVQAFAVSGFASTVNPENELAVKRVIEEETGLGVCCGHELSSSLNFFVRANTAVLNAGIIPLLEQFISNLEAAVRSRKIGGGIMIVRGDGSLMSREKALLHPVETTLSGPAASIAGASFMTGGRDAMVIDVGGTTSDIGILKNGRIKLLEEGARVGRWRTHVKAVDMSTLGTGGDSRILLADLELKVGPRRVTPVCHLQGVPGAEEALAYLVEPDSDYFTSTAAMEILRYTGKAADFELNRNETLYLALLKERPHSVKELCEKTGLGLWRAVNTERLEQAAVVERCGLTPTDLLTAAGKVSLWAPNFSAELKSLFEKIWSGTGDFVEAVFQAISMNLLQTLVLQELDVTGEDAEKLAADPIFGKLMMKLKGGSEALGLTPSLKMELVGVGAAAPFLLEKTAGELGVELNLPADGDVANAVGAVTSRVRVIREAEIIPGESSGFQVIGLGSVINFEDYGEACGELETRLVEAIRADARTAGTSEERIRWKAENRMGKTSKGSDVFLARIYTAEISGLPVSLEAVGS